MKFNISFLFKNILLSLIIISVFYLSGCISPERIQEPGDLTKDIKIEEASNLDIPSELKDVDSIKKKLSEKVVIPVNRETKDFVDPFIAKSIKGIELLKNKQQTDSNKADKNESIQVTQQSKVNQQNQSEQQSSSAPVNLATESITMFTYEGSLSSADGRRAILRHTPTNRSYIVKTGTIVGGYKITDIQDNNLVLVMGSEKLVIPKNKK